MYDFFLQIHLSGLNGMETNLNKIQEKKLLRAKPVATVFFRLSHKSNERELLTVAE